MSNITSSPFNEYREEQSSVKLKDYFVQPELFNRIIDNKPKLIFGSRGTGKTTILKALTLDQAADKKEYIKQNNYLGIYYRADLNIASAFCDKTVTEDAWFKLFSYYFCCALTLELFRQIDNIKEILKLDEVKISEEASAFYSSEDTYKTFKDLITKIKKEIKKTENFINNLPLAQFPYIGAYESMLREVPRIIFEHGDLELTKNRHVIYLIDEFESLEEYQQKAVFTFLKYANQKHTFVIGLRPLGLKTLSTNGGEYIRETDDYITEVLDDQVDYEKLALEVCNKRLEIFYKKNFSTVSYVPRISDFFETKKKNNEIELIFKDANVRTKHNKRVTIFLESFKIEDDNIHKCLVSKQEIFYFLILKLIKEHNKKQIITKDFILQELKLLQEPDRSHKLFMQNYRVAILYYIVHLYSKQKDYSGFKTLVSLSGHTLRYLLEMCDEIFLKMHNVDEGFYVSPKQIPPDVQTDEVMRVSRRRLEQIKAVPGIGPTMRRFMNTIGTLATIQTEDTGLAKWEVNHFSIKPDSVQHQDITIFLNDCVFRGVLLQLDDNKIKDKNTISYDQSIYQMHPIYTPKFRISWRKKQKFDFSITEVSTMIGEDINKINDLTREYESKMVPTDIEEIVAFLKKNKNSTSGSIVQDTIFS